MSGFKRSPSKVWWVDETSSWNYTASASPGSQDSGFSDTEASPPMPQATNFTPKSSSLHLPSEVLNKSPAPDKNLTRSFREKKLHEKNISQRLKEEERLNRSFDANWKTPKREPQHFCVLSDPPKGRHIYVKNARSVNKNLFSSSSKVPEFHQYARSADIGSKVTHNAHVSEGSVFRSSPNVADRVRSDILNSSAPPTLGTLGEEEDTNGFASESDSELENLFAASPKHTSTPNMRHGRRRIPLHLRHRHHQQQRVPPVNILTEEDNLAVQMWARNIRHLYEAECMTTLQCKSISAELHHQVLTAASKVTASLRNLLNHTELIEGEFRKLATDNKYAGPLAQNLAGIIMKFLEDQPNLQSTSNVMFKQCYALRNHTTKDEISRTTSELYKSWTNLRKDMLGREVFQLCEKLENPTSELNLRATVTGITSLTLRHEFLVELFVKYNAVSTLLVFCEKCDASSLRATILRALTTLCSNGTAVRHLEKSSGVKMIAEILEDNSRPEPELSESVALLAQITAPWIDDGHRLHGLYQESKQLVKALTRFIASTKCCQNLLLAIAALANLSSSEPSCVNYIIACDSISVVFEALKQKVPNSWVYVMEQVAMLLANMSATEEARKHLIKERAPAVLLCFLNNSGRGEDVDRRLQQKVVIALSRLCSEKKAAEQIASHGGVEKLVKLCREKTERFNSDAVLVAALATLRKIVDACGSSVISEQDAQELVQPKLLDSFLTYSTQNESYV